ncbi:LPS export ABC transporter permease LptG [Altericroceibacterium endophyticum]|uniref:LPS export ABC transporter permease LptG n=1 Tax=Altericroceibacterium endophyticum TaxID=1808508 RepID=A0A6I4T2C6_9SPHN|nr:LPS export ABC transporter permease LptG [Altericroceibacterium endophyticum]MXO65038.1 LPS export ABC transporter permease LptG [Altericroceibacterium endophyticum]
MLDFFPSRQLTIYLAKTFITRILAVLLMLVLVLQMLDLLSESGDILAYPGNGQGQLWTYVSLRIPQLMARFLPYSVLLATIITLATLNQNSEVVAMKAAGLSAHQILAPLLLTALVVAGISFAFNERVVTRSTATLKAWTAADYGPIPKDPSVRHNVYYTDGTNILTADSKSGSGAKTVLEGVTYYTRDAQGMISRQVRSPRATYANPGWFLENPTTFDVQSADSRELQEPLRVARGVTLDQMAMTGVDPDALSLTELADAIDTMKRSGRHTSELEGKWWHKISGPLSAVLMPLLGAVAGFGLARSGQLFMRAIIGMALGFAYFVVDNAALAMGGFGGYPPVLAAWAPFMLFFFLGETVLIRTEE